MVEDALRESLHRRHPTTERAIELPVFGAGGMRPGVDLDDSAALLDVMSRTTRSPTMRLVDVNVLVYAHRLDAPRHADYAAWLRDLLAGQEPYGISDLVLSGSSGS